MEIIEKIKGFNIVKFSKKHGNDWLYFAGLVKTGVKGIAGIKCVIPCADDDVDTIKEIKAQSKKANSRKSKK